MRFPVVVLLVALVVASAATGAVVSSGNPTGTWATTSAIQSIVLSSALGVGLCDNGVCKSINGRLASEPTAGVVTKVLSATVTGIGPTRLVNGARRYQLFSVRACTIYYYRGAHRFGVHFRWFTRRPPGGVKATIDRDGKVSVGRDDGEPYPRDWNHPLRSPLALDHC